MIQIFADGVLTYDSRLEEYDLQALKVTRSLNKGGTAEIVMPLHHPAYGKYKGFKTVVEIYRDGVLKFRGRALYPMDDYNGTRTVVCEGELCFLQDAVVRPYLYQQAPADIFHDLVATYNSQMEPFKQFTVGTVDVTDPNDYIRLESESAESVLAVINKLLERCGGYISFSFRDDARIINWTTNIGRDNRQSIELGENLFDFASSGANTDLATAILPYGAKDETTGERVTIKSVNGGLDYIVDADAVALRGTIIRPVVWDDVTDPQNLLNKARLYLNDCRLLVTSLQLTALDLSYIDKTVDSFEVGDTIRVLSAPHKVDEDFQLVAMSEDMINPAAAGVITLGKDVRTLTSLDVAGDDKSRSELNQKAEAIKKDFEINVQKSVEAAMQSDATRETLTSIISQQAGDITLEVSGSLGSKATIKMSAFGSVQTAELDLENIRQAFADDLSAVTIEGGTIAFNSNTLIVNSSNLRVSADGTIYATNAVLSGTATTENELYKSELSAGRLRFFYDGTEYGGIASDYIAGRPSTRGVTVRLTNDASYMGFSRLNPEGDGYNMWYCINFGANINDRTEQHLFFGTSYFSEQMNVAGAVVFGSTSTFYGAATFLHNATFNEAVTFQQLATYNGAVKYNGNAFFASGKGVAFTTSTGGSVFALNMTNDLLYVGHQDAPVYVYGKMLQLGMGAYPTTITGSSVTISNSVTISGSATLSGVVTLGNGYGVRIQDASGTAQYVMSLNSSNQLTVGNANFPIYLRGTGVTVSYGGLALVQGSVILPNGYGVVICDASNVSQYVLSLSANNQVFVGSSSYQLYLRGTGVYLQSSGATVTSDERKKNSIEALPDAYEALLDKLTPVRFRFNDGTSGRFHAGFIAQEVQEALEAAGLTTQDFGGFVDINKDGEELGLIYSEFIALLLLKIKRQEQRIAALEAVK